ncbi:MAG: hypothetical protein ABSG84_17290 [Acidobacteriaceae bacterium]
MTSMVRKTVQATLILTVLMIGCSKAGSEFVGKWVNSSNSADTMTIARNGDQFQITGANQQTMDATIAKDGTLQMAAMPGMDLSLTYVKSSDTLQAPGLLGPTVYKRAN